MVHVEELDDGYLLGLDEAALPPAELGELLALEGRCCPFLRFATELRDGAPALVVSGEAGVKEFLRAEFGLGE